ncbi:topology modulation protein [Planococcus halotolerans]|uniref:Topology modulation protein n=1 Tax=Planococcus halotolerans TaxID=2233542 RepID=A0A365KRB3_9BACL|nr:topology modulation protein [Planococcus halotolerans]QHJ69362.1 topology modulation protein [Planococcus halotolerans]RAZ75655.1 topology modulation protein [Planococcus halotolerans]
MKKIIVCGVSAGAGKSTFARKLGEKLEMPVHHLDSYYWKAGWLEREKEEFRDKQRQLVKEDTWIIEGNYASSMEIRLAEADTFIYLELPLRVCLYRALKRWVLNYGKTRPDMAEGCPEKMDKEFLKFIVTTYADRKIEMRQRAKDFIARGPDHQSVILQTQKQIDGFLK